jgi:hypothetical protein
MLKAILAVLAAFMLGIAAANATTLLSASEKDTQRPQTSEQAGLETKASNYLDSIFGKNANTEVTSPKDRVKESQILVSKDKITLDIPNAIWATFTDTNSMDPVLDSGSNAIEIIPSSEDDLEVGDIVAYESEYAKGLIIHRIVHKASDEKGTYFVLKGDNNPTSDPGRVRYSQIRSVVVAIIY